MRNMKVDFTTIKSFANPPPAIQKILTVFISIIRKDEIIINK